MSYHHKFKFHGADICFDSETGEYVAFWTYQVNVGWHHAPEIVNEVVEVARDISYSALYWPLVSFLQEKGILPVIKDDEEDIA